MIEYQDKILELSQIKYQLREFTEDEKKQVIDLANSIREKGLVEPIIVEQDTLNLVTGQKRLAAHIYIGLPIISCRLVPTGLEQYQLEELHIHSNLYSSNLPWYEQVILVKRLHEIRQQVRGKGKSGSKSGWSMRDTAEELSMSLGAVSEDIRLANAVLADPNLRKVEDKQTARKLIFDGIKRAVAEEEAGVQLKGVEYDTVHCGDASGVLHYYDDCIFDVCFTDPPWLEYKDASLTRDSDTLPVFKEIYRVLKRDAFLYVVCSTPDFFFYSTELVKLGFQVQKQPLIWVKQNIISHGLRSWEYARDFEPILLAVKGSPVFAYSSQFSSVYTSPAIHNTASIHPNEKPIDVPGHFLSHCTFDDSFVLDPFGGSGSTAVWCKMNNRRFVTIERNKKFADAIERRLNDIQKV